jgi:DNA-binding LytR/AlgR family response regulator
MLLNILIIEDESLAVSRLKRLLGNLEDDVAILAELSSVRDSCAWFSQNFSAKIDLIFSDIQLEDGISFEIFEKISPPAPVIFTTAFDEYLFKAFKTYGIDYLLKPFSVQDLQTAVEKYKFLTKKNIPASLPDNFFALIAKQNLQNFPTFISYQRDKIFPIKSEEILYFSLNNQAVFAFEQKNKWLLNETLNQIQEKLPPYFFFRANRQQIIQRKSIEEIAVYLGGRLKIKLKMPQHEEIIISKDNCKSFKDWLQA